MGAVTGNSDEEVPSLFGDGISPDRRLTSNATIVVMFGPPGSGKGTQASLLSERLGIPHISTGDMLRSRIRRADDLGRRIAERIDFGHFVPDDWINQLLDDRVQLRDCRGGFILDGYPRTVAQASRLVKQAEALALELCLAQLVANAADLAQRFAGRRQCDRCGALFHLVFQPSLAGAGCDRPRCDGKLVAREDDREEFLEQRLADYRQQTAPVVDVLAMHSRLHAVLEACDDLPAGIHERLWQKLFAQDASPGIGLSMCGIPSSGQC